MLLGKRPRPPMRKTASMAGFSDGLTVAIDGPSPSFPPQPKEALVAPSGIIVAKNPRRNNYSDLTQHLECSHFLKACGLCKRRLGPGRDTFMYRGEMAFCSLECRQKQISMDEESNKAS